MDRECIKKHRKEFEAWLEGKEIQFRIPEFGTWHNIDNPSFADKWEYRIKVKPEVYHSLNIDSTCDKKDGVWTGVKGHVTCPDCLAKMLPSWVKIGAKCFTCDGLAEITHIHETGLVAFKQLETEKQPKDSKCLGGSTRKMEDLTPAIRHAPTCAELAKYMPLCLKLKGEGNLYRTVLSMTSKSVIIIKNIYPFGVSEVNICDLHEKYTYADGSEIGEWRKA